MSVASPFSVFRNNSDSEFRGWGSLLKPVLTAGGFVQTADAAQIDWGTVSAPNATNQVRGYEMYRSNDAVDDLLEWFLKLEYGSGAAIANPSIWATIGWGSDGNGNLSGILSDRKQITPTTPNAVSHRHIICAKGGPANAGNARFVCTLGDQIAGGRGLILSLERTRNADKAFTNDILRLSHTDASGLYRSQVSSNLFKHLEQSSIYACYGFLNPPTVSDTDILNGVLGLGTWQGWKGVYTSPSENLVPLTSRVGAAYSEVDFDIYGIPHHFMISSYSTTQGSAASWGGSAYPFAVLYE